MVRPDLIPAAYPFLAYRAWQALFALDERLRPYVPKGLYYNAILTAQVRGSEARWTPRRSA